MIIPGSSFLVTGGAGFIGSHLVDRLLELGARKVVIFDNFIRGSPENIARALQDERAEVFGLKGDLTNLDEVMEATQGADGVFHLAGLSLLHCDRFPRAALNVNVNGSFNLFEACVKNGVKRLIHSSSASVYGDAVYTPMDESHPLNNRNFYGATKIALEAFLVAFHEKYGLDYVGLRYMNVYGPRQDYLGVYVAAIIKIIDQFIRDECPIIFGDGSQSYDFVYVDDVILANILAMESDVTNDFFNAGTGIQTSILELARLIMRVMGKTKPIEFRPQAQSFVVSRVGCTKKAAEILGFQAQVSLEEGIRKVVEWRLGLLSKGKSVRRLPSQ